MFLLVAKGATPSGATFWVAAIREADVANLELRIDNRLIPVPPLSAPWKPATISLRTGSVDATGLSEREPYPAELLRNGTVVARASVRTPPSRLPADPNDALRVLVGSCYCRRQDEAGEVATRVAAIQRSVNSDLNLLCGDQVYLDSPWYYFTVPRLNSTLERVFAEHYEQTWVPDEPGSMAPVLESGPTYFLADDHEFWNNAPTPASFAVNTLAEGGRKHWWGVASGLYERFQSDDPKRQFEAGGLRFFLADTRVNREGDRFMLKDDLDELDLWVTKLKGPGVVAIGQPIFTDKVGTIKGTFGDWALPNFAQYGDLVRALAKSTHSIVMVTGDVHYGRVAFCTLPSGADLVEVISSPLRLVDASAGKKWESPPSRFPAVPVPEVPPMAISTAGDLQQWLDHFLVLEFSAIGNGAHLAVRFYPIDVEKYGLRDGKLVFERNLY